MSVASSDVIVVLSDDESANDSVQPASQALPTTFSNAEIQDPNRWWESVGQYNNEGTEHRFQDPLRSTSRKRSASQDLAAAETTGLGPSFETHRLTGLSGLSSGTERTSKYFSKARQAAPVSDAESIVVISSSDDENDGPTDTSLPKIVDSPVVATSLSPSSTRSNRRSPIGTVTASYLSAVKGDSDNSYTSSIEEEPLQEDLSQVGANAVVQIPSTQQSQQPVFQQPQQPQQPRETEPEPMDEDSDDEIAVLSKEEAEKTGKFKPTTFSRPQPAYGANDVNQQYLNLLQNHTFGAPLPSLQQHVQQPQPIAPLIATNPRQAEQDKKAQEYFAAQNVDQLRAYDQTLDTQLVRFDKLKDDYLRQMREARLRLENLSLDSTEERSELMREINSSLADANTAIQRAKKIRRYKMVLSHVLQYKEAGLNAPRHDSFFGYHLPQYPQAPNPYAHAVTVYDQPQYGTSASNVYDDTFYLQELLKDVGSEEKIEGMAMTPSQLSVQLLDHQRRGLNWLLKREKSEQGSILADDMGLGKTVQTIALVMANPPQDEKCKTTLIVGPVSLLRQWSAELRAKVKMEHKLSVAFYHGNEKKKVNTFTKMKRHDIVLVSYTTLASEYKQHYAQVIAEAQVTQGQNVLPDADSGGQVYESPFFSPGAKFYRVVLDEAQYIKNKISQTSKATALLKSVHRLCLTGTPMQNNIDELFPILRFLKIRPYNDETKFKRDISVPLRSNSDEHDEYDKKKSMKMLRAVLSAIMLRRTKDSKVNGKPLMELPKKTVENVLIKMEKDESKFYKDLESGIQKKAADLLEEGHKHAYSSILTLLLRLRQACLHQILVEVGERNALENKKGDGTISNWRSMYVSCQNFPDHVKENIAADLRRSDPLDDDTEEVDSSDIQLTCPMCYDVVDEANIVLFHPCGHMICAGCVGSLFEQDRNEDGSVPCTTCRESLTGDSLVAFPIYHHVVNEKLTFADLKALYGSGASRKKTTGEKIDEIIREKGGFDLSAKMQKTLDIIENVTKKTTDEKIIVFSHFTGTFDLMGRALKDSKVKYLRYDGTMSIDFKNTVIRQFYQGEERVLLISLKAGNVGLTLTCASHVIIMDPFWNPFVEDQAMDRAHRFGQQRPVKVYKLLVVDSVEDRIVDLQERKKELVNSALDTGELKKSSALNRQELGYLFGLNTMA